MRTSNGRVGAGLAAAVVAAAVAVGGATAATQPPPVPPGGPIELPEGPMHRCTMTGPTWTVWGIHDPDGPSLSGTHYLVTAWGLPCATAKTYIRRMFPVIPPHATGPLKRAPKGFRCHGTASGLAKNRMFSGVCRRRHPAAMFYWEPK